MHNDEPRMELRALIAVILSMAVLATYQYFFVPPSAPEVTLPEVAAPALNAPAQPDDAQGGDTATDATAARGGDEAEPLATAVTATDETQTSITAGNYRATLTNRGARVTSMVLPDYRDDVGDDLDLVSGPATAAGRLPFEWVSSTNPAGAATLNDALFVVEVTGGSGFGN